VRSVVLALVAGVVSFLAFPPFGPGWLILPGIALFLLSIRLASTRRVGFLAGAVYGLAFFGGLMSWLAELELIALVLVPVQALFLAVYGWWIAGFAGLSAARWLSLAVGGWAVMELTRYHFPVGGLEWGAAGYALSDSFFRLPAAVIGTSGLTVMVVLLTAVIAQLAGGGRGAGVWASLGIGLIVIAGSFVWVIAGGTSGGGHPVAIVQGSTPCPFEHCPPDERLRTFQQHLDLTRQIEPGSVALVIWSEGSTGSTNADPVNNPEIGGAIAAEARRIGAAMLVGGDRTVSDTHWVNANVYFDSNGEILGEYRKQHPVPFGEYIPWRPLFEWIPALDRVPRDMIPGEGPVVFEGNLGSVISFEGGFSRYALGARRAGADVIVVATNEASYGPDAPTSDQFIGMTRMRAVELGVPVIHSAVTGKSTVVEADGELTASTGLGTSEILYAEYGGSRDTPYTVTGDLVMYLAAIVGIVSWARLAPLVGSTVPTNEEETSA
jgi:apolipoprotein N-acyltransferase